MSWQNYLVKRFMRSSIKPRWKSADVASGREAMDTYVERFMPAPPPQIEIEEIDCDRFRGERLRKRNTADNHAVLYLHGGAFMSASSRTHRGITCGLAMENAGAIWALDYPLAPENSIERIQQACVDAYEYLLDSGNPPDSIAIAGDQAGAWLAAKTLIRLRDMGRPLPATLVLLCPFLDTTLSGASFIENKDTDPISDHSVVEEMLEMVFVGVDRASPEWCLLQADLRELPPTLVQGSDIDILVDDAKRMAKNLEVQGCEVRLEIWKNVPPIWHLFWWAMPEAKSAIKSAAKFIDAHVRSLDHEVATARHVKGRQ